MASDIQSDSKGSIKLPNSHGKLLPPKIQSNFDFVTHATHLQSRLMTLHTVFANFLFHRVTFNAVFATACMHILNAQHLP